MGDGGHTRWSSERLECRGGSDFRFSPSQVAHCLPVAANHEHLRVQAPFPRTRVVPARIRLSELRRTSEGVGKSLPCLHACSQPLAAYIGPVGVATACMSSITAASTQFGSGKSSAHLLNTVLLRSTRPVRGVVLTVQRRTFATIIATAPQQQVRIQSIRPSSSERAQGKLSRRHKQTALEALHHDGVVVLENAIDPAILDRLNERMSHDTRTLIDRGTDGPSNYNLGNLQQSPPYELASFSPSIFILVLPRWPARAVLHLEQCCRQGGSGAAGAQ